MRRVTATREVVNSARRKCSDSISDMVLFSFDVLYLMIDLMFLMIVCFDVLMTVLMIVVLMFWMIVLMIWQSPRQQKCEVGISLT